MAINGEVFAQSLAVMQEAAQRHEGSSDAWYEWPQDEQWQEGDPPYVVWEWKSSRPLPREERVPPDLIYMNQYTVWPVANHRDQREEERPAPRSIPAQPIRLGFNGSPLTIPQVCGTLGRVAPDESALTLVADTYVHWAREHTDSRPQGTYKPLEGILGRSLLLTPTPYRNPDSSFLHSFGQITPEAANYKNIRTAASAFLGRVLSGEMRHDHASMSVQLAHEENRREAIPAAQWFEDRSLVKPDFWLTTGVRMGAVFVTPGTLPIVHERLQQERGITEHVRPGDAQRLVRAYVNNMLHHYAQDPSRNQTKIRQITALATGGTRSADLGRLIGVSNGVASGLNEQLRTRGGSDAEQLPRLDERDLRNIGDALLRILYVTTDLHQDPSVLGRQFQEDMMHIDNIERLRERTREGVAPASAADLRLRHPAASRHDIASATTQLRQGESPVEVKAWLRGRQAAAGEARGGPDIWRSGYGILS